MLNNNTIEKLLKLKLNTTEHVTYLDKQSEMIILHILLTTFEVRVIFEAVGENEA